MDVRERVEGYRRRMRERGYRVKQVWVPDVRAARFAAEARRQARAVAVADAAADDMAFVESITEPWDQ